jgi:cholesterol transport system auxiliary component
MRASAAALVLLLAGCSGGLHRDVPPTQHYVLRAAGEPRPPAGQETLRIGRTTTAPGLDTDRIVLVQPGRRMDYYAASRWAAPLPEVVEALAAETLRNTGAWLSVHDSRGAFPSDYFLQISVLRFEADYTQGGLPRAHVVLDCTLGRRADRERLAAFTVSGSAAASDNRLGPVIAAFEQAAQQAMADLAARSEATLRTSTAPSPP